ncbi:hypothetical protein ACOSP7_002280 [Xanthoceras sorbifolium]
MKKLIETVSKIYASEFFLLKQLTIEPKNDYGLPMFEYQTASERQSTSKITKYYTFLQDSGKIKQLQQNITFVYTLFDNYCWCLCPQLGNCQSRGNLKHQLSSSRALITVLASSQGELPG